MIIDYLTKTVYHELIKVTIDIPGSAKVIINLIVYHYSILKLIITDQGLLIISKFGFSLYYSLSIKKRLFTAFYPQINSQIKR